MQDIAFNRDPRITTANSYWTKAKPSREAQARGVNRLYYNMLVNIKNSDTHEQKMLLKLKKEAWYKSLTLEDSVGL